METTTKIKEVRKIQEDQQINNSTYHFDHEKGGSGSSQTLVALDMMLYSKDDAMNTTVLEMKEFLHDHHHHHHHHHQNVILKLTF